MREPRSYVVRIYRQGFRSLSGTVEDTATTAQRHFRNEEELLSVLRGFNAQAPSPSRRKQFRSTK
jgi:hypothetical protein